MKICYLANAASIHTIRWVNYFAEKGYDVYLITWHPPKPNEEFHQKVKIYRLIFPPQSLLRYAALIEVLNIIQKIKPDVIHAHYISHFGILGSYLKKILPHYPLIITLWGSDLLIECRGLKKPLIIQAMNLADAITCDAYHMKEAILSYHIPEYKIQLIFFGTDVERFRPLDIRKEKNTDNNSSPPFVILSLRSLEPIYNIETLIRAISIISLANYSVKAIIAGKGSEADYLKDLAKKLKIPELIDFIGFIPNNKLPDLLNSANVYVSTSLSDAGLAASTAEAMSCGIIPIITDFGDNRKWIKDGENGFLFPMYDEKVLAQIIIDNINNPELKERIGKNARATIVNTNNFTTEMGKIEYLYKSFNIKET